MPLELSDQQAGRVLKTKLTMYYCAKSGGKGQVKVTEMDYPPEASLSVLWRPARASARESAHGMRRRCVQWSRCAWVIGTALDYRITNATR